MDFIEVMKKQIHSCLEAVDYRISHARFDKTFKAEIVTQISEGKYLIRYKGQHYTASGPGTLADGESVTVCAPQNNWSELFIRNGQSVNTEHNHDARYYTEKEVNQLIARSLVDNTPLLNSYTGVGIDNRTTIFTYTATKSGHAIINCGVFLSTGSTGYLELRSIASGKRNRYYVPTTNGSSYLLSTFHAVTAGNTYSILLGATEKMSLNIITDPTLTYCHVMQV